MGVVPVPFCPPETPDEDAGLCYPACQPDYNGVSGCSDKQCKEFEFLMDKCEECVFFLAQTKGRREKEKERKRIEVLY